MDANRYNLIWIAWISLGVLGLFGLGCKDKPKNYVPPSEICLDALEKSLKYWKDEGKSGEIPGTSPAIHVTDANRLEGQKLVDFKVLGETTGVSGRTFAVQLTLDPPKETVTTEYIVVGIDPLWVFRRQDFELLMHWDHHMPDVKESQPSDNRDSK